MIIKVKVYPKSKLQKIIKEKDGLYKVHLISAPEKGKANKELFQILSEYLNISKKQMTILQGINWQNKIIKINQDLPI